MKFSETDLRGAYIIDLEPVRDERGSFARAFCGNEFEQHGLKTAFVQGNISSSKEAGTLRGLHYQTPPYEEAKLICCIRGALLDVIIDLRTGSPTYLRWTAVELTADNRRMLYAPEGFAHGYQTLAPDTEAFYWVTQFYHPESERAVRWNDPAFGIPWPLASPVLSAKDQSHPDFQQQR